MFLQLQFVVNVVVQIFTQKSRRKCNLKSNYCEVLWQKPYKPFSSIHFKEIQTLWTMKFLEVVESICKVTKIMVSLCLTLSSNNCNSKKCFFISNISCNKWMYLFHNKADIFINNENINKSLILTIIWDHEIFSFLKINE